MVCWVSVDQVEPCSAGVGEGDATDEVLCTSSILMPNC